MNNYYLQQNFLDIIKEFSISNPEKEINKNFIYSNLMGFNVQNNQGAYLDASDNFEYWMNRFNTNPNIKLFQVEDRKCFLWFTRGKIRGNEIKLYIPMDIKHLKEGANILFDFVSKNNIEHQSKIANKIRNDNVVIRVNKMEDAVSIINFVKENEYINQGMLKVNPFLPNCNGVGITMDNAYSYNMTLCNIISDFLNYLKQYNRLDLFNVVELNKYINSIINGITEPDLKDIYSLISKVTTPNFKLEDFAKHANSKLSDKYKSDRKRIVDPTFYFENAIKVTNMVHPQNTSRAILEYLKGNPNYFTNQQRARDGLVKYVKPGDIISIMRTKLYENNIQIPRNDQELINQYLMILINKELKNHDLELFEGVKRAYINTLNSYNKAQARFAIEKLIYERDVSYFTNGFKDRDFLKKVMEEHDIKRIILNNINLENLDIQNKEEVVNRFEETIKNNVNVAKF